VERISIRNRQQNQFSPPAIHPDFLALLWFAAAPLQLGVFALKTVHRAGGIGCAAGNEPDGLPKTVNSMIPSGVVRGQSSIVSRTKRHWVGGTVSKSVANERVRDLIQQEIGRILSPANQRFLSP
jgi:hypothetical protein